MLSEDVVKIKLNEIFNKRSSINFEENEELKATKLLGRDIQLPIRELVLILYDIEKSFAISIPKERVIEGYFDSYNHIMEVVIKQVV